MGGGARALQVDPNACRELQTFWDGSVEIDVSAADYVVADNLSGVWVRAIESGDVSGGNKIVLDYEDYLGSGDPAQRTSQSIYVRECVPKSPFCKITKIHKAASGTTATKIRLYYQRAR